ncbi:phage tail length tape measure family protein [Azorhizophilus paspali]|uniref:Phage tail length tape measure family protein n=1 Tax=Azorhizophilus paspali TaxID=69963 RepID=A0ABV6SMH9_AZOPA
MATDSLGTLSVDLIANTGSFERGMDAAERKLSRTTRDFQRQEQAAESLVGRIDPVVGAINRLVKEQAELEKHFKAGIIPTGEFERLNKILNEQLDAVQRGNRGLTNGAMSAKAYENALRGVPAQFTDIAVSLAAGQPPLMVLLQQGGQLKDMFGGIGPAAKALGGYIAGLITPTAGLASVVGVLALTFYDAEKRASEFNKAVFAGNNASGVTGSGLAQIAEQASAVTGSLSSADKAAIALASSAKVGESQLKNLIEATIAIAETTGKEVDEVAKSLAGMGDNATDAAAKISEQYGLLTYEQFQVIKAIDEQGESQKALDTLSEKLNRNAQERLRQYRESLSDVERDWIDIKNAIGEAYSLFRSQLFPNLGQEIEIVQNILRTRQEGGVTGALSNLFGFGGNSTEELQKTLDSLLKRQKADKEAAEASAEFGEANQKLIELDKKLNDQLDDSSKLSKREGAVKKLKEQFLDLYKSAAITGRTPDLLEGVDYDGQNFSGGAYDKLLAEINERTKEKAPKAYREDAGQRMLDNLRKQYAEIQAQNAALNEQDKVNQKLGVQASALAAWEQQLADIKENKNLTADQKSILANADLISAQLKRNAALEKEVALRKQTFDEQKKAQEDYKQLIADLRTDEERLTDQTRERLKVLDAMQGLEPNERNQVAARIAGAATTDAPKFGGLAPEVGGAFGELLKIDQAEEELAEWYAAQLKMLDQFRKERGELTATWDAEELAVKKQHEDALAQIEQARQVAQLAAAESIFGDLASMTAQFAGEQSGTYKALFAVSKAFAIADSVIQIQNALAKAANNPWPANLAAMASVAAATAGIVSNIAAIGMAHDGIDSVPETGTWLLQKGERVTTAETSAKLDATLEDVQKNQNSASNSGSMPVSQTFNINGDVSQQTVDLVTRAMRQTMQAIQQDARMNGPIMQTIRRKM